MIEVWFGDNGPVDDRVHVYCHMVRLTGLGSFHAVEQSASVMPDISKMGRCQELECFTMTAAVRTNTHLCSATPIFSAVGALVAKIAFTIRGDENWKAGWIRRGVPRLPNAAEMNGANRNALRQGVDREHAHRHGPRASEGDPVLCATIGIDQNIENDLSAAVCDLPEVLWFETCHSLSGARTPPRVEAYLAILNL